jgi:NAD(P)-dependent dehydrogenase (short-subunit alcohol dehydrogenase family)
MVDLSDRTVVVTGAGRGIGEATALAFGERGANVVVNDVGVSKEGDPESDRPADQTVAAVEAAGGTAAPDYSDVGTVDGAGGVVDRAYESFGRLDVVYNNAGILRESSLVSMTEEDFDEVIRVHLKGMFLVLRAAAKRWREEYNAGTERDRAIVNASSEMAAGAFMPGNSAYGLGNYAMAKAGILGLTRTAAEELADYDVRVNTIWPMASTRMTEKLPVDLPAPDPVAETVVFLARTNCEFTGQTLRVGGDRIDLVDPAPLPRATAYAPTDAWDAEGLADRFDETLGQHVKDFT